MSSTDPSRIVRVAAGLRVFDAAMRLSVTPLSDVDDRLIEPTTVIEQNFTLGDLSVCAILAAYNTSPSPSRGPMVWGDLNRDEVLALARATAWKNVMYRPWNGPLHGGLAIGVRTGRPPSAVERTQIRAHLARLFAEIGGSYIVAPDCDSADMTTSISMAAEGARANTAGRSVREARHSIALEASGIGAAIAAEQAFGKRLGGLTVAVSGYGRAGHAMARRLVRHGAKLVAVAEEPGAIDDSAELDLSAPKQRASGAAPAEFSDAERVDCRDAITYDADLLVLCRSDMTVAADGEVVAHASASDGSLSPIHAEQAEADVVLARDVRARAVIQVGVGTIHPAGLDYLARTREHMIGSLVGGGLGVGVAELEVMHRASEDISSTELVRQYRRVDEAVASLAVTRNLPRWAAEVEYGSELLRAKRAAGRRH